MELELHQLDRRYEALRTRSARRERRLLASLSEVGQQTPIVVVRDAERWVVVDGYKRVRAVHRLGHDVVHAAEWLQRFGSSLNRATPELQSPRRRQRARRSARRARTLDPLLRSSSPRARAAVRARRRQDLLPHQGYRPGATHDAGAVPRAPCCFGTPSAPSISALLRSVGATQPWRSKVVPATPRTKRSACSDPSGPFAALAAADGVTIARARRRHRRHQAVSRPRAKRSARVLSPRPHQPRPCLEPRLHLWLRRTTRARN
jgi:hypothetical protein